LLVPSLLHLQGKREREREREREKREKRETENSLLGTERWEGRPFLCLTFCLILSPTEC
jgi:hypothetical protein